MHSRWQSRQRPLPPEIACAQERYTEILVPDGSTLDALLRKVGLLRKAEKNPLAGRMTAAPSSFVVSAGGGIIFPTSFQSCGVLTTTILLPVAEETA